MKNIGIIGSGDVGVALAKGFLKYGYPTRIGTRSEEKQQQLKEEIGGNIQTGRFTEAAEFGEILILAVTGLIATDALHIIGPKTLQGKIVIDATNPIANDTPIDGVLEFFTNYEKSLMEELQETFPMARFVKAFNHIGAHLMVNPQFKSGERPTMFICGNDDEAKKEVVEITTLFGFETEDMGSAVAARAIEPLCMLWCIPGFRNGEWNHALRLIR